MSLGRFGTMVAAAALACAGPAWADYAAGKTAWDAGRPAAALVEWRAAADGGDRRAMLSLGRLYVRGLGAPQDFVLARMWFNLAASRGEAAALEERDALAAKMTPDALAEAQKRARDWRPGADPGGAAAPKPAAEAAPDAGAPPPPPEARIRTAAAASRGDIDGLKAALAAGADPDARDDRGWTALMHAANEGYSLVVPPLLAAKADPDLRAPDGATALFIATAHGHTEIVSLLSKADADVSIRGPKGKTVVDAARARYGDPAAAREKGEDPAVLALLEGKTLAGIARAEAFGRDCPECPEMVVVRAGSFTRGSLPGEEGRSNGEGPVHRVTIPAPFAVGKYAVTFSEWDACVSAGGCGGHRPDDRGWGRGRRPAIYVSWNDAKAYVRWLSRKTGKKYRLLSESEWEYAARADTTRRYPRRNVIVQNRANCDGCGSVWDDIDMKTAPVGRFAANGFGLHDMSGNVWEWVADCWNASYAGAPSDGRARESGNCGRRVLRGGSWFLSPRGRRAGGRAWLDPGSRNFYLGFRVARTLTP